MRAFHKLRTPPSIAALIVGSIAIAVLFIILASSSSHEAAADPLKRYPRVMMPHRFDALAKRYLLDPRTDIAFASGDDPAANPFMSVPVVAHA